MQLFRVPESVLVSKRFHGESRHQLRYLPQTIDNTCGTIALLNLLLNIDPSFRDKSENEILSLHNENLEFQKATGCLGPDAESEETELHFVAILVVDGIGFYEIDGRNPAGFRLLAPSSEDIFKVIQNQYAAESLGNMSAMLFYY